MVTLLVIVIIATGARGYSQSVSICVYDTYVICYIELIKNFLISISISILRFIRFLDITILSLQYNSFSYSGSY